MSSNQSIALFHTYLWPGNISIIDQHYMRKGETESESERERAKRKKKTEKRRKQSRPDTPIKPNTILKPKKKDEKKNKNRHWFGYQSKRIVNEYEILTATVTVER